MIKKRALGLMVPVLLLAAMFGVRWWQSRPSEADLWLQEQAREATSMEVNGGAQILPDPTAFRAFTVDQGKIRYILGLLSCGGTLTNAKDAEQDDDGMLGQNTTYQIILRLKKPKAEELIIFPSNKHPGSYYIIRHRTGIAEGVSQLHMVGWARVRPSSLQQFLAALKPILTKLEPME